MKRNWSWQKQPAISNTLMNVNNYAWEYPEPGLGFSHALAQGMPH
jgi:hypothetical protein